MGDEKGEIKYFVYTDSMSTEILMHAPLSKLRIRCALLFLFSFLASVATHLSNAKHSCEFHQTTITKKQKNKAVRTTHKTHNTLIALTKENKNK